MNAIAQVERGRELTVVDRARAALKYDETKAALAELAAQSVRIVEITNAAGRAECHAAMMKLTNTRTTVNATGKAARDDSNKFSSAVIAAEKELIGIINPEETRLRELRDKWDADREAEKLVAIEAERQRVAAIQDLIQEIKDTPAYRTGTGSAAIHAMAEWLAAMVIDDTFYEFAPQAQVAKDEALAKLRDMHAKAIAAETEAKRIADEQAAERERLRIAQEALDRRAAELRAEQGRKQAAWAQLATIRAMGQPVGGLDDVRESLRLAEALVIEPEFSLAAEAEQAKASAIQSLRTHIEQAEAAAQLAQERAALELKQQQEEAARQQVERDRIAAEEAEAIANATLREAAEEALGLLIDQQYGDHFTTRKLASALAREQQA